jgi:hypothetical protein
MKPSHRKIMRTNPHTKQNLREAVAQKPEQIWTAVKEGRSGQLQGGLLLQRVALHKGLHYTTNQPQQWTRVPHHTVTPSTAKEAAPYSQCSNNNRQGAIANPHTSTTMEQEAATVSHTQERGSTHTRGRQ